MHFHVGSFSPQMCVTRYLADTEKLPVALAHFSIQLLRVLRAWQRKQSAFLCSLSWPLRTALQLIFELPAWRDRSFS